MRHSHFGISFWVVIAGFSFGADMTQLTSGPGNDTEAAWSPDGRSIVFQSDRNGSLDLFVLDVATKKITALVEGPGHAALPAWSPDGKWIVYSYANFAGTALAGQEDGYNLYLVPAAGGSPRRLTRGHYRDYSPAFRADGKTIWFSSDRGAKDKSNAVSLCAVGLEGGEPELVLAREGTDRAAVQVTFSPDGRICAFGSLAGFLDNWRIRLAHSDRPGDGYTLTTAQGSFYGPRWCPVGTMLACTGFKVGDAGWGVWLLNAGTGQRMRVDTGPGNSRSPAWNPDGKSLVVENNRTGNYKLYGLPVPPWPAASPVPAAPVPTTDDKQVLHYRFAERPGPAVADTSSQRNQGQVHGSPAWRPGAIGFASPDAWITIPKAKGFDFGPGPFSVQAVVEVPGDCKFGMIAMGEYPGNRLGWQLYVTDDRRAWFNSRAPDLNYRGARSDEPLPAGRPVTLTGVRDASGCVRLYVDGSLQQVTSPGATYAYVPPVQVRIGSQYNGASTLAGWVSEVAVYARELSASEIAGDSLTRFWDKH